MCVTVVTALKETNYCAVVRISSKNIYLKLDNAQIKSFITLIYWACVCSKLPRDKFL